MQPKRYFVWSKNNIDLSDPWQRKWYIQQVLTHGRAEDVAELDWDEINRLLPEMNLPREVRSLWEIILTMLLSKGGIKCDRHLRGDGHIRNPEKEAH